MLDKQTFLEGMAVIAEILNKPLSEPAQKIYYTALREMTGEQFQDATARIISTRKFTSWPTPAEWLEHIIPDNEAQVIGAWDKVVNAMARVGAYQTVIFDDPLIHGFIQGFEGGWPALCSTNFDTLVWVKKEFERYYKAVKPQNITCKPLIGISEGDNAKGGREHAEKPVYIGDEGIGQSLIADGRKQITTMKELEG